MNITTTIKSTRTAVCAFAVLAMHFLSPTACGVTVTIDFDGIVDPIVTSTYGLAKIEALYREDGFILTTMYQEQGLPYPDKLSPVVPSMAYFYSGSTSMSLTYIYDTAILRKEDGSQFGAVSIDMDALWKNIYPGAIRFTGLLAGGQTVEQTFVTDVIPNQMETFYFSRFDNLVELRAMYPLDLPTPNQYASFDNIVLTTEASSVPDTGITAAMLGVALVGLVALRRKLTK